MELTEAQTTLLNKYISEFIKKMKVNRFIVWDTETNGIHPPSDPALSISAELCRITDSRTVEVLDTYDRYYYCPVSYNEHAIKVNGLTYDKVKILRKDNGYPEYFNDDKGSFIDFCGNVHNYIGHNIIQFDSEYFDDDLMMDNVFDTMLNNQVFCPLRFNEKTNKNEYANLKRVSQFYDINIDESKQHQSHYDVELSRLIFGRMLELSSVRMIKIKEAA